MSEREPIEEIAYLLASPSFDSLDGIIPRDKQINQDINSGSSALQKWINYAKEDPDDFFQKEIP